MNSLTVYEFETTEIEVVEVNGSYWFNASQVAKALGYANPSKAVQDNVAGKYNQQLDLGRPGKKPVFVNEPGLYQLIMRSSLASAEKFQDWVFEDVLPSIRKTGGYSVTPVQLPQLQEIGIAIDIVFAATAIDPRLTAGVKANQIAKIYPSLASAMEESKALLGIEVGEKLVRPGKLSELYEAKTGTKLSARKMNTLLMDKGLQIKNPSGTNPCWLPTDQGEEYSQLVLDTAKGHNKTVQSLQWYPSVVDVIYYFGGRSL